MGGQGAGKVQGASRKLGTAKLGLVGPWSAMVYSDNHDTWWCDLIFFRARVEDPGEVVVGNVSASTETPLWDLWFSRLVFSKPDLITWMEKERMLLSRDRGKIRKKKEKGERERTNGRNTYNGVQLIVLIDKDLLLVNKGFPGGSDGKEPACNVEDPLSIPGSGRSPGEGIGNPFQDSFLENLMDRGAWRAIVSGVIKSQTWLSLINKIKLNVVKEK